MATWVTHLMIADRIMEEFPQLDRRGFSVGNIAPDCNVENEDWTAFEPPKAVTHWMSGERKIAGDSDCFCEEYILSRKGDITDGQEYSFLLGYYAHLIADAEFQRFIRDEDRVRAVWHRIKADGQLCEKSVGMDESWDSAKLLIPRSERMREIYSIEAKYLSRNPASAFLTEIVPLESFPDYIDYLPKGCIVRKIGVMGYVPQPDESVRLISISEEEYCSYTDRAAALIREKFLEKCLL